MRITIENYGDIALVPLEEPEITALYKTASYRANYSTGSIQLQTIESPLCRAFNLQIEAEEPLKMYLPKQAPDSIAANFCMGSPLTWLMKNKTMLLQKDQFNVYNPRNASQAIICEAKGSYALFVAEYGLKAMQTISQSPAFRASITALTGQLAESETAGYSSNRLSSILACILKPPVPETFQSIYRDYKFSEMLLELLTAICFTQHFPLYYNLENTCRQILELIKADLNTHYTIAELARRFHVNEVYLKRGFKALYGMGVYKCLQQERMILARHLLLTTSLPIKVISSKVGFAYTGNFITAFNGHFGYTPGSLRNKSL